MNNITEKKISELVEAGKLLNVKVTPDIVDGNNVVNIRDFQFADIIHAQLFLQHIANTEVIENLEGRVG